MNKLNDKILFCIADTGEGPILTIGLTEAGWDIISGKAGEKFHHMDVRGLGFPLRIILIRGKDREELKDLFHRMAQEAGVPLFDRTDDSFGIDLIGKTKGEA